MSVQIESVEVDDDIPPRTAKGRVYEWSRIRHHEMPNPGPGSPFYKIHREQENAGVRSGTVHDIITVGGETVAVPPDGGLGDFCDRYDLKMRRHNRMVQTTKAIEALPSDLKAVILEMYGVVQRERPRAERLVAESMGLTRIEVIKRLERAYGWLSRDMGIPPI